MTVESIYAAIGASAPLNFALLGRRGAGKTTIANLLVERGYQRHSWAAPVKEIASWAYGPVDKAGDYVVNHLGAHLTVTGRWLLQRIGTDALRNQVDEDFWIKVGLNTIDKANDDWNANEGWQPKPWVNDDTRFPNEVQALHTRGFVVAYVIVPDEIRFERLGAEYDRSADSHPSETSVSMSHADVALDGRKTPAEIVADLLACCD